MEPLEVLLFVLYRRTLVATASGRQRLRNDKVGAHDERARSNR